MINTAPEIQSFASANLRERLFYALFVTSVAVVFAVGVAFLWYSMPPATDIFVGKLDQFPASDAPYPFLLPDGQPIFIVNDGTTLLALDGIGTHIFHCRLIWRREDPASRHAEFSDPCAGGGFALNGGYLGGPSPRHMDRFRIRVAADNRVYVDPQVRLRESEAEYMSRCVEAQKWRYGKYPYYMESFCPNYTTQYYEADKGVFK